MTEHSLYLDPRARRTLDALQGALGEHMRTQQIGEISVSEICRTAGVHRTTFYKHFESVADLAALAVTDLLQRITEGHGEDDEPTTYAQWFAALAEHVALRGDAYRSILGPKGDPGLQRAMSDQLTAKAREAIDASGVTREDLGVDPQAAALGLGHGAFGAISALVAIDSLGPADAATAYFGGLPDQWARVARAPIALSAQSAQGAGATQPLHPVAAGRR